MRHVIVLAGDIGGTKTDLALATLERRTRRLLAEASFPSRESAGIEEILGRFLGDCGMYPDRIVLGVAGPVVGGRARLTNLPWEIEAERIRGCTGTAEVLLMNDLEAIASAIPGLTSEDLYLLHPQTPEPEGTMAVIAPGTGLGEAFLVGGARGYRAYPSEGGHVDFAPRDSRQEALLGWLRERYGHVSYEHVCSGMAMFDLYRFAREALGMDAHEGVAALIAAADDPTPLIVDAALAPAQHCPACRAAVEIFTSVLAAEAGNLGLKVMATGGIYLAGGMPRRILPLLGRPDFHATMCGKGQFGVLVDRMPVYVVTNPKAALLGAIRRGMVEME